jgi:hypothetical protein
MKKIISLLAISLMSGMAAAAGKGQVNDFPTLDRVEYVLACARDASGSPRENIYKCSCVVDAIAERLSYEQYVEYSTTANAFSIGGERGEVMRGYNEGKELSGKFRKVQAEARKACFMR